ncbi:MAG: hypothetical protein EP339_07610 [Gammaproteobacteria bacterium]|uniref:Methyl-accepting chemotaxis protein n=1 Tax=Marinobacter nitratireducens TaxID=1137280 RepID=A0A072N6G3_9GAMM|nr:hypothetical protein [Marinobacter nitratireducens]KEF32558.1 hypothetical protein D777_01192 [Marinobacter nitratireducens]TNE76477.1 MAG: hypothetical protein EP339_07610 [Gammaproteobacteria bacterium]TNE98216.1 MAG: hypothetical protein EP328_05160 [Gammaproteobacteria bacterium]
MNDTRLRVQSLVAALILLALTSLGARAQETPGGFLSDLHTFRISNYMALDAYYRFSASGDTNTLNEIVAGINAANDAMNTVAGSTSGILSEEQVESLNKEFDTFKGLMRDNINDVRKTGYPDLRLVSDMANQALGMNNMATELYQVAQDSSQTETSPRIEAARMAAVKMAQMMAKYSARTNSSVSQTFQGSSTETPLDEQAREFDELLEKVKKGNGSNRELKATIEDVASKWLFIRKSYINYNENNVSFVIDRYSKGILEGLATTITLLEETA